eukprot:scaffold4506_cov78-Skeletonema_dohrnii-CCMP3373.AAC.1
MKAKRKIPSRNQRQGEPPTKAKDGCGDDDGRMERRAGARCGELRAESRAGMVGRSSGQLNAVIS